MTIEEKAKAYDKALEKANWLEIVDCPKNEALEELFPQLKDKAEPDFDDEGIRKAIIAHFWTCYKRYGGITFCNYTIAQVINWLKKQGNQKSAEWSEEDSNMFNKVLMTLAGFSYFGGMEASYVVNWFKSLKNRVQLQPVQEWSKEDGKNRALIYAALNQVYDLKHNTELCDWLNHLKYYPCWKPNDEQMKGIECAIKTLRHQLNVGDKRLDSLYEDLKKIKGK